MTLITRRPHQPQSCATAASVILLEFFESLKNHIKKIPFCCSVFSSEWSKPVLGIYYVMVTVWHDYSTTARTFVWHHIYSTKNEARHLVKCCYSGFIFEWSQTHRQGSLVWSRIWEEPLKLQELLELRWSPDLAWRPTLLLPGKSCGRSQPRCCTSRGC